MKRLNTEFRAFFALELDQWAIYRKGKLIGVGIEGALYVQDAMKYMLIMHFDVDPEWIRYRSWPKNQDSVKVVFKSEASEKPMLNAEPSF